MSRVPNFTSGIRTGFLLIAVTIGDLKEAVKQVKKDNIHPFVLNSLEEKTSPCVW